MFHVEHGISLHWSDRGHESLVRESRLQLLSTDPSSRCSHGLSPQNANPEDMFHVEHERTSATAWGFIDVCLAPD
jgi:hypothetical protein